MTEFDDYQSKEPIGNYEDLPDYPTLAEPHNEIAMLSNLRQIKETINKYPNQEIAHQFTRLGEQLAQYHPIGSTLLVAIDKDTLTIISHTVMRELHQAFSDLGKPVQHTLQDTARRSMAGLMRRKQSKADKIDTARLSIEEYIAITTQATQHGTHLSSGDIFVYDKDIDPRTKTILRNRAKELYTTREGREFSASNLVLILLQSVSNPDGAYAEYVKAYAEQFAKISKAISDEKRVQYFYQWAIEQNKYGFPTLGDDGLFSKIIHLAKQKISHAIEEKDRSEQTIAGLQDEGKKLCRTIIEQLVPPRVADIQTYQQPDIDNTDTQE